MKLLGSQFPRHFYPCCLPWLFLLFSSCRSDVRTYDVPLDQPLFNYTGNAGGEQDQGYTTMLVNDRAQRVWVRSADVNINGVRFRIGLIDTNKNGHFHERETDYIVLNDYQTHTARLASYLPHIGPIRKRTFFQIDRHFFEIILFDAWGRRIIIQPCLERPDEPVVAYLQTSFPKIPVETLDGQPTFLKRPSTDERPSLLLFWSTNSDKKLPLTQVNDYYQRLRERVSIYNISMLDHPDTLRRFLSTSAITLPTYRAGANTCRHWDCHTRLPYGMLFDDRGRVLERFMPPARVIAWLDEEVGKR